MPRQVSVAELRAHTTSSSLWTAIDGKVYDLTTWLERHPGGVIPLFDFAGKDSTEEFKAFHPLRVGGLLQQFYVGELEHVPVPAVLQDFRQLRADIEAEGLFNTDLSFYVKHGCVLAVLFTLTLLTVALSPSALFRLPCAVALGLIWNMCSFVGHDTGHNGITHDRRRDSAIGLLVGNVMTGIGIGWWKKSHNVHHLMCNSVDYDPDIQHVPLLAISPAYFRSLYSFYKFRTMPFDAVARSLVRYQHLYFYPLMAVARVNLYLQTLLHLLAVPHAVSAGQAVRERVPMRLLELLCAAVFFTWFSALLASIPGGWERLLFFLVCMATSGILHVQIVTSHFGMPVFEGRPADQSFVSTQLQGTLDIECQPWMDWFWGGLQFQIEHHLFPRLPRHNLRRVAPRVLQLARKHGLPYTCVPWLEANRGVLKALYAAAVAARRLPGPAVSFSKSFLWEGMRAVG